MEYLHSRIPVVVHRDLKLANVMLDDEWDVRLVDFGLAKMIGCDQAGRFLRTNT